MFVKLKSYGTLGLVAWAFAGPIATYAWTSLAAFIDKRAAVAEARKEEKDVAYKQRIADLEVMETDKQRKIAEAREEAMRLTPTPDDAAELQKLCDRSASCRDRRKQ